MEEESKGKSKCPRCGEPAMEIDVETGKAVCRKCGYRVDFQKV